MNLCRCFAIGSLCLLLLITLAACKVPMPGRVLLSTPRSVNASAPVAAIEADGTRHFAWVEPGGMLNQPGITYYRVNPDGAIRTVPWFPTGLDEYYTDLDLVVAASGTAYLAYNSCTSGTFSSCSAYYVTFPKDWNGTDHTDYGAGVGDHGLKLVQRGNTVYVLGVTAEGNFGLDGSHISYRQLPGGTRQGLVADEPEYFATDPSGVIDAAGDLHVAFHSSNLIGTSNRIGYTNNVGTTGNMAAPVYKTVPADFHAPAISRSEAGDDIYVAYAVQGTPSDSLYVWHPHPAPGTDPVSLALGSATDWQINGSPALAATGTYYYQVFFSASNSASDDFEIWTYTVGDSAPYQVTNDTVDDGPPVAAKAVAVDLGPAIEFPIYAWRTTYSDPGPPTTTCYGAVKVVADGSAVPSPRTIFQKKVLTCGNYGYDLAVNEDRVLGVWLDVRDGSSILEPWYSMDGDETFLPAIRK